MPVSVKANTAEFEAQRTGRTAQILARQQAMRDRIPIDPLLPLSEVRAALGVSYGTLNKLLQSGKLPYWQAVPCSQRRVRQSVLTEFLTQGDRRPEAAHAG
jgi:excisionase family DNA binding protein